MFGGGAEESIWVVGPRGFLVEPRRLKSDMNMPSIPGRQLERRMVRQFPPLRGEQVRLWFFQSSFWHSINKCGLSMSVPVQVSRTWNITWTAIAD